jgi:arylsulfatase A-like enzyme
MTRTVLLVLVLTVLSCASQKDRENTLPNIIYIYADDMGVGDVGCYGQKYIKTPNIDRMAAEGIRFTRHYTGAPICAPARCSMLTGKNAGHTYVRMNYELHDSIPSRTGQLAIPDETVTIAEVLKKRGYATAVIGKWGLGSIESSGNPNKQGFDLFYGYADQVHAHNHFPTFLWRNSEQVPLRNDVPSVHPKYDNGEQIDVQKEYKKYLGKEYSLDLMTEEAMKFMDRNMKTPFFLYLPFVVPHKALQVPDESLAQYDGVFDEKPYDGRRGYTPHPRPLSAYAAMISRMDSKIGEILDYLREHGLEENTLVMFSSDNGPAGNGGGLDTRFFNSSAGLRGGKGQVFEGGIREPLVAYWPGKIAAGVTTDHLSAQYDLMATLAELSGQTVTDTDGISFLPTLLGRPKEQKQHEYLYWEMPRGKQIAVRIGDMKGILIKGNPQSGNTWAVYNLAEDEKETTNVAAQHPDLIKKFESIVDRRTPSVIEEWNF